MPFFFTFINMYFWVYYSVSEGVLDYEALNYVTDKSTTSYKLLNTNTLTLINSISQKTLP